MGSLIIAFIIGITEVSFSTNISVWPKQIKFNYEPGNTNDAIYLKLDNYNFVPVPEWVKDTPPEKMAYIAGQSNRKIQVSFDSNCENMHLLINLTVTSGTGIGTICNYFISNYHKLDFVTLTLSGSIPNSVGKRNYTWQWSIYAIPIDGGFCSASSLATTDHTYYTLISNPLAPMENPWTPLLDKACYWASGQTNVTNTLIKITEGLYNHTGFLYNVVDGSARYTINGTNGSFDLTTMLDEIGGYTIKVNCYDMGKALKTFSAALGCNTSYLFVQTFGYLNCIKAIGRGWSNNPFYEHPSYSKDMIVGEDDDEQVGRSKFNNHAFCQFNNLTFDACLKVDVDSDPDDDPHTESWAYGWVWGTYKSNVVDNIPATSTSDPISYNFSIY
ncbi:MAG: hypothetical protein HC905_24850 [Bacteroidales bacterium]|nr:hypothetical protein [Bacteroidales bacterium]